ncbi:hypothetical protein PPROV_000024500 [Pycnococcus provasolii]|uniref:RNB domain-containing protein n=2 Tax=Pycnococcus provasolii TaxID=41880 RepID=A0A830H7I0_9CHLO|nr:hypothetical protein PPROV_000024500 [Pycnococcus provasolii]
MSATATATATEDTTPLEAVGTMRCSASNRNEAYLTVTAKTYENTLLQRDLVIDGAKSRGNAIDSDTVRVVLEPPEKWKPDAAAAGHGKQAASNASFSSDPFFTLFNQHPQKRPTARVVEVVKHGPRRERVVARLEAWDAGRGVKNTARLSPIDPRLPFMACREPKDNAALKAAYRKALQRKTVDENGKYVPPPLVKARVVNWKENTAYAMAEIVGVLGEVGQRDAETVALLANEGIDITHPENFPAAVDEQLAAAVGDGEHWRIPVEERTKRRDFTAKRVFSIDPPTARDLDDALHVDEQPDGTFVCGVHIADVSHFVTPGSPLDDEASKRCTSVYLVQKVLPMLPRVLCERLCSLQPNVERLTFSIEWRMDAEGNVLEQWIGRGIIRSVAKLAYGNAQALFDADDAGAEPPDDMPVEDQSLVDAVRVDLRNLRRLAAALRAKRMRADGSIALQSNNKLSFAFAGEYDEVSGDHCTPVGVSRYESREANRLVEDFMLLANRCVATFIAHAYPDRALLRRHAPPEQEKLTAAIGTLVESGKVDLGVLASLASLPASSDVHAVSDRRALSRMLEQLRVGGGAAASIDSETAGLLTNLLTKPMQLAVYFATGAVPEENWSHYALGFERYTHFTSPIRRYPDVEVHRLVQAALDAGLRGSDTAGMHLGHDTSPAAVDSAVAAFQRQLTLEDRRADVEDELEACAKASSLRDVDALSVVADACNLQKEASKRAQEASLKLHLVLMLRTCPLQCSGLVCALGAKHIDVYIAAIGTERRIYMEEMPGVTASSSDRKLSLSWHDGDERRAAHLGEVVPEMAHRSMSLYASLGANETMSVMVLPADLVVGARVPVVLRGRLSGEPRPDGYPGVMDVVCTLRVAP